MMNKTCNSISITAAEFLVDQSNMNAFSRRVMTQEKRSTSFQVGLTTDAQIDAIATLTDLSRNKVIQFLLESGIEQYESAIQGDDVHEQYLSLINKNKDTQK